MGYYDKSILSDIEQLGKILTKEELPENGKLPKLPLQQIIYGAPGTGKSFGVDDDVKKYCMRDIRTIFHPDSDYSTFVGAYKPQMERMCSKQVILDYDSLVDKFKEYIAMKGNMTVASTMIGFDFHDSIIEMQPQHSIADLVADAYKSNTTYDSVVRGGMAVYENSPQHEPEKKIVYKYTQQAFLKAYIAAWKDLSNPHILVIEEINRGNCAQIFGDLFQLLDRNDIGFSKYPITADTDIMQVLNEEFEGLVVANSEAINAHYKDDVVADVLNGSRLLLPNNLYIWATMNTSDQSLFPIDSAFKRRWEWRYVPISDAGKKWKVCVNGTEYDWWSFIEQINNKIWDATHSEDKKLGYFFCKADRKVTENDEENNVISADRFVGKVLFYIYNDVFKDYGFDDAIFKDKEDGNKELLFQCFFKPNGKPEEKRIEVFLKNLEVELASKVDNNYTEADVEDESENTESDSTTEVAPKPATLKITFDDEVIEEAEQFPSYLAALRKIGMDKVEPIAASLRYSRHDCPLVSKEKYDKIVNSNNFSYIDADGYNVIKGINKRTMVDFINQLKEELNLNIEVN